VDVAERRPLLSLRRAVPRRLVAVAVPVLPLLTIYAWLCLLYGWEAWGNLSPWLVTDEFQHTQLSRAIATTGHEAVRSVPQPFDTLYVWLIAPAWWIYDTSRAYGLAKAIGVATMTSVIFPTYLFARTLVSTRWAIFAATGAALIPAMMYSALLLQEPLAYPWAALTLYLVARALITVRPRWILAAAAACIVGPYVRGELSMLIPASVVAAFGFWFTGERARRFRSAWWHWLLWAVAAVLALAAFQYLASHHSANWALATGSQRHRLLPYSLWAFGALTIGLGVLPTIAGLSALVPTRGERLSRAHRAFICVTVPTTVALGLYTGIKATVVGLQALTVLVERNVIYEAPLLFVGTALVLSRRRVQPVVVAAATAATLYLATATPYKMEYHFFFDAPGLAILQSLNRVVALTPHDATILMVTLTLVAGGVVGALRFLPAPTAGWVALGAAAFVLSWTAYGEVVAARSSHDTADSVIENMPRPLNWIDRTVPHGAKVTYLGQSVNSSDPNGVLQLEFWNRTLSHVWSTDQTVPGPGPNIAVEVVNKDGVLRPGAGVKYVVADYGVSPVGRVLAQKFHVGGGAQLPWTLYRVFPPLRLRTSVEGIYTDGWTKPFSAFNQYSIPNGEPSYLVVHVSRAGGGKTVPATVDVKVGSLRVAIGREDVGGLQPFVDKLLQERKLHVRRNLDATFIFDAPKPPFRVETSVSPFTPFEVDPVHSSDRRVLGAQVDYRVIPKVPKPEPGRAPEITGVDPDGWAGADATYTQWSTRFQQGGFARVKISRKSWHGPDVPGHVTITVRKLGYDKRLNVVGTKVESRATWTVHSDAERTFLLATPDPPFRVEVHTTPLFVPHRLDRSFADKRKLGAQISFGFKPI
jgi:hypothetical protein